MDMTEDEAKQWSELFDTMTEEDAYLLYVSDVNGPPVSFERWLSWPEQEPGPW